MKLNTLLLLAAVGATCADADQTCNENITESSPTAQFVTHGDGTATDTTTDLMWMRCSLGQTWSSSESSCSTGSIETYSWRTALAAAEGSEFASYTDWRLPNIKELASLVEQACTTPAINATIFPDIDSGKTWSSTTHLDETDRNDAYTQRSSDGLRAYYYKGLSFYVRLVRGGQ